MHDVAILLNLTSRLTFEETDSLMSLVTDERPLLFYDRLSVKKFPSEREEAVVHTKALISKMRNLLEARMLSVKDQNERIRLIVTLDLSGGLFQSNKFKKVFPAQRIRMFKSLVTEVFEPGNLLLKRFEYAFIFVKNELIDPEMSHFYQLTAYDGFGGQNWIFRNDININEKRNSAIAGMKSPDEESSLAKKSIAMLYQPFKTELDAVLKKIGEKMKEAGVEDEFNTSISEKCKHIQTVGDFNEFNYDEVIYDSVKQIIGLSADEFKRDCTFFILRSGESTFAVKRKDEVFIKSLVQLLASINNEDYGNLLKSRSINMPARLFVLGDSDITNIDKNAFEKLKTGILHCKPKLEESKWSEAMEVEYNSYSLNASDPRIIDTHRELNDQLSEERQGLYDKFLKKRKVPFFFGKKLGDWSWYNDVVESVTQLFKFESENELPLYDAPKRITNEEMKAKPVKSSYRAMENELNKLMAKNMEIMHMEDLNGYILNRRELLKVMEKGIATMKKNMLKLGYFTCLFWIGVLSVLAFTLCYAYHFFWFDNADPYYLIAIAFGALGLLFILSSVIGQSCVKGKIKTAHRLIDNTYEQMQKNLKQYIDDVNKRVRLQNLADLRKRNIDEMQGKLDEFRRHNKRIDLWAEHFNGVANKIENILELVNPNGDSSKKHSEDAVIDFDEDDFDFDTYPSFPTNLSNQFKEMTTSLINDAVEIHPVTCMVKHFSFTEIK